MPLWFFPALMAFFAVVSLCAGIWLLLHFRDVARVFRGEKPGQFVRGPGHRRATKAAVWTALLLFNGGWVACVAIWLFVMSGEANLFINAKG